MDSKQDFAMVLTTPRIALRLTISILLLSVLAVFYVYLFLHLGELQGYGTNSAEPTNHTIAPIIGLFSELVRIVKSLGSILMPIVLFAAFSVMVAVHFLIAKMGIATARSVVNRNDNEKHIGHWVGNFCLAGHQMSFVAPVMLAILVLIG